MKYLNLQLCVDSKNIFIGVMEIKVLLGNQMMMIFVICILWVAGREWQTFVCIMLVEISWVKCLIFAESHFSFILWKQSKHPDHFAEIRWIAFYCPKAWDPLQGDKSLLITKFPGVPGTHLIYLGRIAASKPRLSK